MAGYPRPARRWSIPLDIVMAHEVADSYCPSPDPYALGSLSSSRPASTESKATNASACFFEVPNANQNDDLMVRPFIIVPNGAATANVLISDVMSFSKLYATFTKRRNARQSTIWYETAPRRKRKAVVLSEPSYPSSSTSSLLHRVVLERLCPNGPQRPFLKNGAPKLN